MLSQRTAAQGCHATSKAGGWSDRDATQMMHSLKKPTEHQPAVLCVQNGRIVLCHTFPGPSLKSVDVRSLSPTASVPENAGNGKRMNDDARHYSLHLPVAMQISVVYMYVWVSAQEDTSSNSNVLVALHLA